MLRFCVFRRYIEREYHVGFLLYFKMYGVEMSTLFYGVLGALTGLGFSGAKGASSSKCDTELMNSPHIGLVLVPYMGPNFTLGY